MSLGKQNTKSKRLPICLSYVTNSSKLWSLRGTDTVQFVLLFFFPFAFLSHSHFKKKHKTNLDSEIILCYQLIKIRNKEHLGKIKSSHSIFLNNPTTFQQLLLLFPLLPPLLLLLFLQIYWLIWKTEFERDRNLPPAGLFQTWSQCPAIGQVKTRRRKPGDPPHGWQRPPSAAAFSGTLAGHCFGSGVADTQLVTYKAA